MPILRLWDCFLLCTRETAAGIMGCSEDCGGRRTERLTQDLVLRSAS